MKCPYCDKLMEHIYKDRDFFKCPGGGPLLTKESGECKFKNQVLSKQEIEQIAVILIDLDEGD